MRPVGLSNFKVREHRQTNFPFGSRPYVGKNRMMTPTEYASNTRSVCVARSATFDTAKPDQLQQDRTLHEVLTRLASGEYRLFCPIDKKWVTSPKYGLRQVLSIQWVEYYDVDRDGFDKIARVNR